jgi:Zn-dependent peptidase ImmA (M78 family)
MGIQTAIDAAAEANRVRREFWLRGREGWPYPVDPVRIAKAIGVEVLEAKLAPGVSGALVKEAGRDATILLAESDSKRRKRFTCAHEIGHFMLRRKDEDMTPYSFVDKRDELSAQGQEHDEMWANAFAAELLMPEEAVREWVRNGCDDLQMAARFGVSPQAMNTRLSALRLTT